MIGVKELRDVTVIILARAQPVQMIVEVPHVETASFYRPYLRDSGLNTGGM